MSARTRMQIRVVLTVFRSEMARLSRADPLGSSFDTGRLLRVHSLELLDAARARLDGDGVNHPDLLAELSSARDELRAAGGAPAAGRVEVSADSRQDRHG